MTDTLQRGQTRHQESSATIDAPADAIFAQLDDQTHLAEHMGQPSIMTGGGRMTYKFDDGRGRRLDHTSV